MKRIWIKAYIEILDDPKMGRLPDLLWRRALEFFMLAGEHDQDGLLPPLSDMAWRLRTTDEQITGELQALSKINITHETPQGWMVTHFKERQAALTGAERQAEFRKRHSNEKVTKRYANSNEEEVTDSSSSSPLDSSLREEEQKIEIPETQRAAMQHPDIKAFQSVSGSFPGSRDWGVIIESVQYLRQEHGDKLKDYLMPYWSAWSARKTKEGKPYSKTSAVWLCEWAMQGQIPPANGHEPKRKTPEDTQKILDEPWRNRDPQYRASEETRKKSREQIKQMRARWASEQAESEAGKAAKGLTARMTK